MRAAAILADQIEMPILYMAKQKKALELREFHADVLRLLKHWATDGGVAELMSRSGDLMKQAYPEEKQNWAMEAIVAPHATDDEVKLVLQGCCEAGVEVWQRHAAGSFAADGVTAKEVTVGERLRAGATEGNNDHSERKMGMLRYLRTQMHRLRVAGKQALIMLRLNKPLVAVKAGELGQMCKVFALARTIARTEKKAAGPLENERRIEGEETAAYREQEAPKPSMTAQAVQARATRAENKGLETAMVADVEGSLLLNDSEIAKLTDTQMGLMIRAWKLIPGTTFRNKHFWPGVKFPKGTGSKGSLKKDEKAAALIDAIKIYNDMKSLAAE